MNIFRWLFPAKTQASEQLHDARSRILRKLGESNLPKDTLAKAQGMINAGDRKTVLATQRIIQKTDGLPRLADLLDKHHTTAMQNSALRKLDRALENRRRQEFIYQLLKKTARQSKQPRSK